MAPAQTLIHRRFGEGLFFGPSKGVVPLGNYYLHTYHGNPLREEGLDLEGVQESLEWAG